MAVHVHPPKYFTRKFADSHISIIADISDVRWTRILIPRTHQLSLQCNVGITLVDKWFETNEGKHNNVTRSPKHFQKDLLLLQLILKRNLDFSKVRDMLFV